MAGRGRGKPTMSFNTEQLGVNKGELPPQVLQPPLPYPMLDLHVSNFESTNEINYLVELKRDFAEYMRDSLNNITPEVMKKDIERYSDHYQDVLDNSEQKPKYDWSRMPEELAPSLKRKATSSLKAGNNQKMKTNTKRKRPRVIDDDDDDDNKQGTEEKPKQQKNTKQAQDNIEKEIKEEEEEDEENSDEEMEEYEIDEEMDDGTDYVNNYFDNGEGFDDEEENQDDGPLY
ncbi:DNA-directed RNA polymerase III subunit RPC7-like [Harpegnathos saltator]|uniref:DNA-directed RNA polymerase III subunit RPC7-like n=1 Tax=Harpegnathos saltator TaxID=610380 RepID=E2C5B1_HARSA|nr:DNA-directed RNA polymerase III subunit RPC7-like [Harpegnathos saltator]XP_025152660.1 DNA-directed RNA polymerase III subunit RPC7-like [Harpegnathos saltator]EFN76844.1 DNA-directed RNA polymerase III subunit RPC7-like [Harpegnathos saltator]